MIQRLSTGDTSLLAELHAQSSALKVLVSSTTITDIETARRSMGGHGFSAYAGLGRVYADYLPSATFEGDNYVLDQQVVRSALKALDNLNNPSAEKTESPSSQYLAVLKSGSKKPSVQDSQKAWLRSDLAVSLLQWRAALIVQDRAQSTGQLDASVEARVSRAVAEAFVANQIAGILKVLPAYMDDVSCKAVHNLYLLVSSFNWSSIALIDLCAAVVSANHSGGSASRPVLLRHLPYSSWFWSWTSIRLD
jgi:acyl-CoA oxidase